VDIEPINEDEYEQESSSEEEEEEGDDEEIAREHARP